MSITRLARRQTDLMGSDADVAVSHLGICCRDLELSLRFYCEGLGFEPSDRHVLGSRFGPALEVSGELAVVSQFIRRSDLSIELLHYSTPQPTGEPSRSRGQLGLTHLSFHVDDVDAGIERLVELGGSLLADTRLTMGPVDLVFLADPDGTRIELMKRLG